MVLLSTRKGLILRFDSIQYSITTCKEIEHLDKNTFAFFMELLWKELWCLHFSKICSNEMADTGHYLNWGAQSFTTYFDGRSQSRQKTEILCLADTLMLMEWFLIPLMSSSTLFWRFLTCPLHLRCWLHHLWKPPKGTSIYILTEIYLQWIK